MVQKKQSDEQTPKTEALARKTPAKAKPDKTRRSREARARK